jgi:hypothetical protein
MMGANQSIRRGKKALYTNKRNRKRGDANGTEMKRNRNEEKKKVQESKGMRHMHLSLSRAHLSPALSHFALTQLFSHSVFLLLALALARLIQEFADEYVDKFEVALQDDFFESSEVPFSPICQNLRNVCVSI